ncbi:hypothetical protein JCM33374_g222 [Metschnikowia sp. JCM 33374]|nr:hypothetical protein JCM33374_g222 [Metschnikowia sp. JCM 33374]
MWSKSSKRRSMAASSKTSPGPSDDSYSFVDTTESESILTTSHVRSLIDPEYDVKSMKHAWLNGVLNASPMQDFNESSLRLYRVELRGSHLYVYRPPPSMNIRSFKLDLNSTSSRSVPAYELDASSLTTSSDQANTSFTKTELHSMGDSTVATASSAYVSGSELNSFSNGNSLQSTYAKPVTPTALTLVDDSVTIPENISYFSHMLPHPELDFDSSSETFSTSSSIEALVHFFMFSNGQTHARPIRRLTIVFPLFPKFGDILKLMYIFLQAIYNGKFVEYEPTADLCDRVVSLLKHIDENFGGFLLKSDVAPYVPKILQCLTTANSADSLGSIARLQDSVVAKQKSLLRLIGNVDASASPGPSETILTELSSSKFMNSINLVDLVVVITEIDLLFFNTWNSSIDKSLLLFTSVCENGPGDYFYKKNPLIFNNETHIHYLSRLLVHHLFVENSHTAPEKSARILEKWIDLGCLLDKSGNMSSWLGISSIILSQPVLRLTTVWTHVGDDYIQLLKNDWSPVLFELDRRYLANTNEPLMFEGISTSSSKPETLANFKESYHIMAPRGLGKIYPKEKVVPYFGDLLVNNTKSTNVSELESIWKKITYSFERWKDYLKNLSNSPEIISYNQDVLRRYDSMGFIFSNESLNQVLYLGVNKDDGKSSSSPPKLAGSESSNKLLKEDASTQGELRTKLFRLLELNCESIDLHMVMEYSLRLEPSLKEAYLQPSVNCAFDVSSKSYSRDTQSALSVDSGSSSANRLSVDMSDSSTKYHGLSKSELSTEDKLPTLNLQYYKIDLPKYDDLVPHFEGKGSEVRDIHNIVVDNQLVLRLDDFISDFERTMTSAVSTGDIYRSVADDDGLGIDVDDIMNSDKFKNFTMVNDSESPDDLKKRHSSFGLVSHNSKTGLHPRLERYIPRFASMDKLIDLLLIDSKYFDDRHPIDLTEYRFVFMLNYSSFITTKELLEKLAHRFIHSGNAVISVMKRQYLKQQRSPASLGVFPKWAADEEVDLSQLGEVDYELLLQIQANILKVLIILLNNFFESFSNDLNNKNIMIKLLKLYSNEILQWYNSNKIDKELNESFESLVDFYKRLKKLFIKKSYRPLEASKFDDFLSREFQFSRSMQEVPMNRNLPSHKNVHKVEKFLNKFNKLLAIFYQGITPKNWFTIFKVLENSFVNHSLLNQYHQKISTPEDSVRITDIFTFLDSLYDNHPKDKVIDKFPLVFRKLYSLYHKFKAYLLIQLCDENISAEERLERMRTLLLMVQISRLKMKDSQFVFDGDRDEIPSCIETAITSVICSPESRSLVQLWHKVSPTSGGQTHDSKYNDIDSLLPRYIKQSDLSSGSEPLLPCFGWIIQNLVDLNKSPSFHRSVINFNKRFFLFKLIKELNVDELKSDDIHKETKEFEFLLNLDEEISFGIISNHESTGKGNGGLFQAVIKKQYSIMISDEQKRNFGDKRVSSNSDLTSPGINTASTHLRRQSLAYKTTSASRFKISGLFNKNRPFGHTNVYERTVTYKELPDPMSVADPRQKPLLVIQLKDRKIFPVYLLPYCFKFDTHNTNEACFFQAWSESDAKEWLRCLNYANRHWFLSKTINTKYDRSHTTFGIPLATICARDRSDSPAVLDSIYDAIEKDGLKEVGIYRISTSLSELSGIKQEINKTGTINLKNRSVDIHTLTSCVKSFFRELPDALLTDEVIETLCPLKRPVGETHKFSASEASAYRKALSGLPRVNYCTLEALARHLSNVVKENEINKMTCSNLATVIGPALTEASNLESLINNFGLMNHILEKLIENYKAIFEPDAAL